MVFHTLYGLLLASNEAIPGLPVLSNAERVPDIQVHLKSRTSPLSAAQLAPKDFYVSPVRDEKGNPVLRAGFTADGEHLVLHYCDGTRFVLGGQGTELWADWPDSLTLEDTAPYLVGPVFGIVLRLRGMVPLHASAVAIGDHAIALAGPAGAGKSTTAAAFARCGYRVISDDVVALAEEDSRFVIPPGYPRVNLWAESVKGVLGESARLPLISPSWDKQFLPLDPHAEFETRSLPLGAIYVLHERVPGTNAPTVEPLVGAEALAAILANTYMNYLPDPERRRREFELLGRVVVQVPIRRVEAAPDLSALPELVAKIVEDVENLLTTRRFATASSTRL
jgi:hypothetical protein